MTINRNICIGLTVMAILPSLNTTDEKNEVVSYVNSPRPKGRCFSQKFDKIKDNYNAHEEIVVNTLNEFNLASQNEEGEFISFTMNEFIRGLFFKTDSEKFYGLSKEHILTLARSETIDKSDTLGFSSIRVVNKFLELLDSNIENFNQEEKVAC